MEPKQNKEVMEYLRIYVMIWQKIDFIWGLFITSYIPLFGFLHFYPGEIGLGFSGLFVVAIGAFTLVNGQALRQHYDIAVTMSTEFRRMNTVFPDVNGALRRTDHTGRRRMVLWTHSFAYLGFLYLVAVRVVGSV